MRWSRTGLANPTTNTGLVRWEKIVPDITTEMQHRLPSIIRAAKHRLGAYPAPSTVNWACSLYLSQAGRRRYSSDVAAVKEKPYYLTTPIFYVNAAPHVGHLYTVILADVLKRWQLLKGREAILCTGTDEHGMKIQQAAANAGMPPKAFCDSGAEVFKSLATKSNTSFDHFIRTTDPKHRDAVQHIWFLLQDRGLIYSDKHEGWYSVSDETFYPTSGVKQIQDPATGRKMMISVETGREVEWTSEQNYHFRLSAMQDKLLSFYATNPNFVFPKLRHNDVVSSVSDGLSDLSISRPRSRLTWGIPVPGDPEQTIYVWLDALISYITASGYPWTPGCESLGGWPVDVHVVGKDIVRFHCIYWPAFLLALDLPTPKQVLTHAHWTMNRRKMSKTEGNVVNPFYAMDRYGVDTMRFYMVHDGGIVDDGDYSNEGIMGRYKNSLEKGLGNLVSRICSKTFDLEAAIEQGLDGSDSKGDCLHLKHEELVRDIAEKVADKMAALEVPAALKEIMQVVSNTDKYIHHTAPWSLVLPTQAKERNKTIYLCAEAIRVVGILLQPFMPEKMGELLDQISVGKDRRGFAFASLGKDRTYGVGASGRRMKLFPPLSEECE